MAAGKLYLLPTPLGDAPGCDALPAANHEVMSRLGYFIVEELRTARRFLSRSKIGRPVAELRFVELNEHTPPEDITALLAPVLAGEDAGLMSEAGLPGVADPGADLVAVAHRHGVEVVPLSGPSSLMLALMASGLNGQSFAFNGYLPIKQPERNRAIQYFERRARSEGQSQIFIETPYRNLKLFEDILAVCDGKTRLCIASDLTQPGQFTRTLTVVEWRKSGAPDIHKHPAVFIIG